MGDIINQDEPNYTKVKKYQFGTMDIEEGEQLFDTDIFKNETKPKEESKSESNKEQEEPSFELLEKIEALTSELVTAQMETDNLKNAHQQELESANKEAFDRGKEEGIKETQEEISNQNDDFKSQLLRSITLLQEQKENLDTMFEHIEEDLVESAMIIAKKVIKKELENDSVKVTKSIASALIETLKDVSNIILKVNRNDFDDISEHFNGDLIKIEIDEAVSRGGVIILSDSTNIDGTISTRLDKAMELIGKE